MAKRSGCSVGQIRINGRCVDKNLPNLSPMIGRVGGKKRLKKTLVVHVPSHDVYVEPFVGGGTLYWAKPLVDKNVINDADPALAKFYKDVKNKPSSDISGCKIPITKNQFNSMNGRKKSDGTFNNPCDYLGVIKQSYGQNGMSFSPNHFTYPEKSKIPISKQQISEISKNMELYKTKLSKTHISNKDFCDVIKQHDSKDTFHYLDPPYHGTSQSYGLPRVHIEEVVGCASKMKGKVLVSYDNHPEVKKAFKGWKVEKVETKYRMQSSTIKMRGKDKDVTELLIMNYNPKTGKRITLSKKAS